MPSLTPATVTTASAQTSAVTLAFPAAFEPGQAYPAEQLFASTGTLTSVAPSAGGLIAPTTSTGSLTPA